jgi:Ni/Co efflux regulator RcnB
MMMNNKRQKFFARVGMLALVAFLALPLTASAQNNGRGRGKPTDVFVNGHDARDGRLDKNNGQRRGNDNYGRNDQYDRNRRGRNWDRYGGYGGSFQLRQTALNAGYNNGIQEGRKDRRRGDRFDYRDEGDFQRATQDFSSRLGDRELYKRYFREGFANGYEDGYRGY